MDNIGLQIDGLALALLRCLSTGICVPSVEATRVLYGAESRSQNATRAQIQVLRRRLARAKLNAKIATTWLDSHHVGWTLVGPDVPAIQKWLQMLDDPRDVWWLSQRLEKAAKAPTTFKAEHEQVTRQLLAEAAKLTQRMYLITNVPAGTR